MRSETRARARADQRRQRLLIGGGGLAVVAIWTLALWPSNDDGVGPQGATGSRPTLRPWTTGPFIGTTPSPSSSVPTSMATSIPTVAGTGAVPRRVSPGATGTVAPPPAPATTTTPVTTSAPAPSPTSTKKKRPPGPPGQQSLSGGEISDPIDVLP